MRLEARQIFARSKVIKSESSQGGRAWGEGEEREYLWVSAIRALRNEDILSCTGCFEGRKWGTRNSGRKLPRDELGIRV